MFSSGSCCHLLAVSPGGLRWCFFFFFGREGWLISLRFVFGAWGGSLRASVRACVRANVRVRLAGSGRFCLECTVGGPVVYMGRSKNGETKSARAKIFVSRLDELAGQLVCSLVQAGRMRRQKNICANGPNARITGTEWCFPTQRTRHPTHCPAHAASHASC